MSEFEKYVLIVLGVITVLGILYLILKNPIKKFKSISYSLDISGKKAKDTNEYVDMLIIKNQNIINECDYIIKDYNDYINEMRLKYKRNKYRLWQVEKSYSSLNDIIMIKVYRLQTRYRQVNYVRTKYYVESVEKNINLDLHELRKIYYQLAENNFELTRSELFSKDQRKLMTPQLRDAVKKRDRYTCQICGKYMPDEVGLHIDHIIPVSKGGKTVSSNLQVLCDKCNLAKGRKI